jgi:phage baseplate assembly protein W
MAYNLKQINVLDLRPSVGVGVALPFNTPAVFQTVYTTQEQLKYNIINFLLTNSRERIFNPNFGANIRSQIFEQITNDTTDTLELLITNGISQYFPNVAITELTFGGDPDQNLITIQFSYTVTNTGQSDNITINLNG